MASYLVAKACWYVAPTCKASLEVSRNTPVELSVVAILAGPTVTLHIHIHDVAINVNPQIWLLFPGGCFANFARKL